MGLQKLLQGDAAILAPLAVVAVVGYPFEGLKPYTGKATSLGDGIEFHVEGIGTGYHPEIVGRIFGLMGLLVEIIRGKAGVVGCRIDIDHQ